MKDSGGDAAEGAGPHLAVADIAGNHGAVVQHLVHCVQQDAGVDRVVALMGFVLRREARADRSLALGHLADARLVPRTLVASHTLEQRGEEEFWIRHALVLAVVARVGRVVEADKDEVLLGRALREFAHLCRARPQSHAEHEVGALQRLGANGVAAVVREVAPEERMRLRDDSDRVLGEPTAPGASWRVRKLLHRARWR